MPVRLVALDEGPDILVDRAMMIVGRHPQCDARLDSIRVSRRHCCMMQDNGELIVRDLGSTNGIRINGQRVEVGRLRPGDELSIAHIRYRVDSGFDHEKTVAEPMRELAEAGLGGGPPAGLRVLGSSKPPGPPPGENPLAAAVRELLPSAFADRCRIQVIVQMKPEEASSSNGGAMSVHEEGAPACRPDSSP
ncbi:MAG: FHA domain-containing protein [Isosphaeraceae bacterium]|nr:FHA domain-containing protein [Isosphaeraceae bacterium]